MASDLSFPSSPGSTLTIEENMVDVESNGLHLDFAPFGLEHIHDYEPDGHHPVHLGDVYGDDGQYRVIHKLGHGGFATVWLCRDTNAKEATKYVALKILMAETSSDDCPELRVNRLIAAHNQNAPGGDGAESICLPLDHFKIHGPNGDHISFVYPVLGPNVSLGLFHASADPDTVLRSLCLQLTKAIEFLHSQGICHGGEQNQFPSLSIRRKPANANSGLDITPNNVLHGISGLVGLNEDDVLQLLGSPVVNPVLDESKEGHHKSTAPRYLVYPVSWWDVDTQFISKKSCLIDFGESFEISQPPDDLGIPGPYRSPELILNKEASFSSDIWALGCSLFEIRTGRKLFSPFDDEDNDYLHAMVQVLGKLPEPWWSSTWKDRRKMFKNEVDEQGLAVAARELGPEEEKAVLTRNVHPSVAYHARSLQDMIAPGLWHMSDHHSHGNRHRDISQAEQYLFADLLGRLLEYKPEDRISAQDAMKHEWFKL